MKKNLIKIIWIILVLIVLIICLVSLGNANATNTNSEKIAKLTFQLSELEYSKMYCLDNLTYKESLSNDKWFTKYCWEYDDQIMKLEFEIDELKEWKTEDEHETDLSALIYDENWNCIGWIGCTKEEREPWMLNESWDAQVMPEIKATDKHERFKEMANAYWLDASTIWNVENHYWIKEWVILCITVAETSGGNRWYWEKNIWSVGSNDRWDRPTYALMEAWLEAIGKTLNNRYLGSKQTLGCLSNAWSCTESSDNGKRYATSENSWEKNMVACLSTIYWPVNPSTFNIRR